MKIRILTVLLSLCVATVFAQKKEIRQATKAVENEDFTEAVELLKTAEPELSSLNNNFQKQYYLAKGKALLGLHKESGDIDGLKEAADNFQKAADLGDKEDAPQGVQESVLALINSGIQSQNAQDFKDAYQKMEAAYKMAPTDTIYLFAAAGNAFNAGDDNEAIRLHKELLDIGYRGDGIQYLAVEKESGEKQVFNNEQERDMFVKSGQYADPTEEKEDRKDGDIIKQLAILYLRNGDRDKAIEAIEKAKATNPGDVDIYKAEAQVYLEMDQKDKFVEIISDLVDKDPDNAAEYYRILGHAAVENEDFDKAKGYYEKAIEINPEEGEAYNGLANIILKNQESIVDEMNGLGMSSEDSKKYDELQEKRLELLKEAVPLLEKAFEIDSENVGVIRTLYNIHRQLQNQEEADKYKNMLD